MLRPCAKWLMYEAQRHVSSMPQPRSQPSDILAHAPCMARRVNDSRFFIEQFATPTGTMLLLTDDGDRVRALDWEDCAARMHRLLTRQYGSVRIEPKDRGSVPRRAVEAYYHGTLAAIDALPVKTGGTPFQRDVWAALRTIPVTETMTYACIAARLGRPKATRAVGAANGANPISIIVPCHRLIGADASLTGYGGGLERKRWLLRHEGVMLRG